MSSRKMNTKERGVISKVLFRKGRVNIIKNDVAAAITKVIWLPFISALLTAYLSFRDVMV